MFQERLRQVSDRIQDSVALVLVGRDGIPVESVSVDPGIDLEALSAELMNQLRALTDDHRELAVGTVRQFAILTDRYTIMISAVSEDYYLLLVLGPGGLQGQARFELRRARLRFERDLR